MGNHRGAKPVQLFAHKDNTEQNSSSEDESPPNDPPATDGQQEPMKMDDENPF